MLILSHRGYHLTAPENTIEAFSEAIALHVDGIETDVRLSADGLPILFHNRLAPNNRAVASLTRSELSAVVGYEVPTLDAILSRFDQVLWNIEIKTPAALQEALLILKRYNSSRNLLVTSFWHNVVEQVRDVLDIDCGIVIAHRPITRLSIENLLPSPRKINTIVWDYEILDIDLLRAATEMGIRNFVYGADNNDEQQNCAALGIYGLITDRPDVFKGKQSVARNDKSISTFLLGPNS